LKIREGDMNFENLEVWKRSCELSVDVYRSMKELNDFGFRDQITRSSLSVPSNIAEGMVKPTTKDKIRYLHIANGSCAEMRTQIHVGMKIDYIREQLGVLWIKETKEISAMLSGLMRKLEPTIQ
jgi:four helix bundle protein